MNRIRSFDQKNPLLLDVKQVCCLLNIGSTTAYALISAGDLRCIRVGKKILVPRAECEDFIRRSVIRSGWRMPVSASEAA
jgi:excisionase family DNA binding protein